MVLVVGRRERGGCRRARLADRGDPSEVAPHFQAQIEPGDGRHRLVDLQRHERLGSSFFCLALPLHVRVAQGPWPEGGITIERTGKVDTLPRIAARAAFYKHGKRILMHIGRALNIPLETSYSSSTRVRKLVIAVLGDIPNEELLSILQKRLTSTNEYKHLLFEIADEVDLETALTKDDMKETDKKKDMTVAEKPEVAEFQREVRALRTKMSATKPGKGSGGAENE